MILLCQSLCRVTAPIRSRCLLVRVPLLTHDEIAGELQRVAASEGLCVCGMSFFACVWFFGLCFNDSTSYLPGRRAVDARGRTAYSRRLSEKLAPRVAVAGIVPVRRKNEAHVFFFFFFHQAS